MTNETKMTYEENPYEKIKTLADAMKEVIQNKGLPFFLKEKDRVISIMSDLIPNVKTERLSMGLVYDSGILEEMDSISSDNLKKQKLVIQESICFLTDLGLQEKVAETLIYEIATALNYDQRILKLLKRESADKLFETGLDYYNSRNFYKAAKLFHKATDLGHISAQYYLSLCYENGYGVFKDVDKAVTLCRKAAEQGNAEAQFHLGLCFKAGFCGLKKNLALAKIWFRKAANQDHADAQEFLGYLYQKDNDYKEAVKWYHKAANQGNVNAQEELGLCYENGQGVDKDLEEAKRWYYEADENGHSICLKFLGDRYYEGKGMPKNYDAAAGCYLIASKNNDDALFKFALMVEKGKWVLKDESWAVELYQKAAEKGNLDAQYRLGWCYFTGTGVPMDYKEAVKWFYKVACKDKYCLLKNKENRGQKKEFINAQKYLSDCYLNGLGVPKNENIALKWKQRASANEAKLNEH